MLIAEAADLFVRVIEEAGELKAKCVDWTLLLLLLATRSLLFEQVLDVL